MTRAVVTVVTNAVAIAVVTAVVISGCVVGTVSVGTLNAATAIANIGCHISRILYTFRVEVEPSPTYT